MLPGSPSALGGGQSHRLRDGGDRGASGWSSGSAAHSQAPPCPTDVGTRGWRGHHQRQILKSLANAKCLCKPTQQRANDLPSRLRAAVTTGKLAPGPGFQAFLCTALPLTFPDVDRPGCFSPLPSLLIPTTSRSSHWLLGNQELGLGARFQNWEAWEVINPCRAVL